jgi:hypothetical protein
MEFDNWIKMEMTEGIVRALLDDAGYRVIEYGVEKTARQVTPMTRVEYLRLCLPDSVSKTPDLLVLDRTQTAWRLVEIKYRSQWDGSVLDEVEAQARQFGELVLISIAGNPENPQNMDHTPARFLRCCRLRVNDDVYQGEAGKAEWEGGGAEWVPVASVRESGNLWWKMRRMQAVFPQINEQANRNTLSSAIRAMSGILNAE